MRRTIKKRMDDVFKNVYDEILLYAAKEHLMNMPENETPYGWNEALATFRFAKSTIESSSTFNQEVLDSQESARSTMNRIALVYAKEAFMRLSAEDEKQVWCTFCLRVSTFDFTVEEKQRFFQLI